MMMMMASLCLHLFRVLIVCLIRFSGGFNLFLWHVYHWFLATLKWHFDGVACFSVAWFSTHPSILDIIDDQIWSKWIIDQTFDIFAKIPLQVPYLREPKNIPLEHIPGIPPKKKHMKGIPSLSFDYGCFIGYVAVPSCSMCGIYLPWSIWGMFYGRVGIFLDLSDLSKCMSSHAYHWSMFSTKAARCGRADSDFNTNGNLAIAWMSQEVSKRLANGLFHTNISHL